MERSNHRVIFVLLTLSFSFLYVNAAGQIYPAEVLLVCYVLHRIASSRTSPLKVPTWIIVTLSMWAFGSLLSDYVADAEPLQYLRGLARTCFLLTDLVALWLLTRDNSRLLRYAWIGLASAAVLSFVFQPSVYAREVPWKFGFAMPTTIIVMLLLSSGKQERPGTIPVLVALSGVHFVLGFRSLAVTTFIVAMLLMIRARPSFVKKLHSLQIRPVLLATAAVGVVLALVASYDRLAATGVFGYSAQQKAYFLNGEYGSLLSSRSEFFLSTATIAKQPLFGGGSFSSASAEVAATTANMFHDLGYERVTQGILTNSAAYHSELLGAWAENGILAVPFWGVVLVVFLRGLSSVIYRQCSAPALVTFVSLQGVWDLFFSPFGAGQRLFLCLSLVTVISLCYFRNERPLHAANFYSDNQFQPASISASMRG